MRNDTPIDDLEDDLDLEDDGDFELTADEEFEIEAEAEEVYAAEAPATLVVSQEIEFPVVEALSRIASIAVTDKLIAYIQAHPFREFAGSAPRYSRLLWDRYAETRLGPKLQEMAVNYPFTLNVLALATVDDPDTVTVLPAVSRLFDAGSRLQLRILSDEEDLSPLTILLPDVDLVAAIEEWDLPQFFLFDEEWELQGQWGPRPTAAEPKVEAWLADHPEYERMAEDETANPDAAALEQSLLNEMRLWYNSGLNQECLKEWTDLLVGLQNGDDAAPEDAE
jgi:hypothetical protein